MDNERMVQPHVTPLDEYAWSSDLGAEALDITRPTTLLVYAAPNGSTAEQTLGTSGPGI